jgi:hypothetical protein
MNIISRVLEWMRGLSSHIGAALYGFRISLGWMAVRIQSAQRARALLRCPRRQESPGASLAILDAARTHPGRRSMPITQDISIQYGVKGRKGLPLVRRFTLYIGVCAEDGRSVGEHLHPFRHVCAIPLASGQHDI